MPKPPPHPVCFAIGHDNVTTRQDVNGAAIEMQCFRCGEYRHRATADSEWQAGRYRTPPRTPRRD